jgi:hypothetical protein
MGEVGREAAEVDFSVEIHVRWHVELSPMDSDGAHGVHGQAVQGRGFGP